MIDCYIGLGSNLDSPLKQLNSAIAALRELPSSQLEEISSWYQSEPIGPSDQPDYVNGTCRLKSTLQPLQLLDALQQIENQHGRVRELRWGARTLDLDLLLFGNQTINTPRLIVPHPELAKRNFVLIPLLEINPALQLPDGTCIQSLLDFCPQNRLNKLPTDANQGV